jgi:SNF2 family DNA or RNA helicase
MTWNRELYDQFIARVWRQGNDSDRVFVHHIMAKDTIDAAVYGALQFKHSTEQALFEGILRYAKERRG